MKDIAGPGRIDRLHFKRGGVVEPGAIPRKHTFRAQGSRGNATPNRAAIAGREMNRSLSPLSRPGNSLEVMA